MSIKRGDIYYVEYAPTVGSEQHSGRPAIVVSNDTNNKFSEVVEVVYMTAQAKGEHLPTHVAIRGLTKPSTALCEQITTVAKSRLGNLAGLCTDEEMAMIDRALAISLGIEAKQERAVPDNTNQRYADSVIVPYNGKKCSFNACDISALMARLEVYKELYKAQMEATR